GTWHVTLTASGAFRVVATGYEDISVTSLEFVQQGGRAGHAGALPVSGPPVAGQEVMLRAILAGSFGSPQFQLRRVAGQVLTTVSMTPPVNSPSLFFGSLQV